MINVSDKSCRENQYTRFCSEHCLENRPVYDIMWKNIVELGRPQMMVRAHFMLDTYGYKCTLRICNTYYFPTATMVCTNAPQCYVIRTLPVLLKFEIFSVAFRKF
jgi:hypothetical protein